MQLLLAKLWGFFSCDIEFLEATNARADYSFGEKAYFSDDDSKVQTDGDDSGNSQDAVKEREPAQIAKRSRQHPEIILHMQFRN